MIDFDLINKLMNSKDLQTIMEQCKDRNPKDVFYEECEKRKVDPESILKLLRG